jgi:hypothetical protein
MEICNTNEDTIKKTIKKEIYESLYELGLNINDIILDINTDAVNLKICICNK